jgi:hypothetical protein
MEMVDNDCVFYFTIKYSQSKRGATWLYLKTTYFKREVSFVNILRIKSLYIYSLLRPNKISKMFADIGQKTDKSINLF